MSIALLVALRVSLGTARAQEPAEPPAISARLREQVASRVRHHDIEGALRVLGDDRAAPARYLRARLRAAAGDLEGAASAFASLHAEELPASAWLDARRRLEFALARLGRCDALLTQSVAGRSSVIDALRAECRFRLALASERAESAASEASADLGLAIAELRLQAERNADEVDVFALRWMLHEALVRAGDEAEAEAELVWLWLHRPAHPEAPRVAEVPAAAGFSPSAAQRRERAEGLARAGRFAAAADLLEESRDVPRSERAAWAARRAHMLFRARRYPAAARAHREAARVDVGQAAEHRYQEARALARAQRDDEAIRRLDRLARGNSGRAESARYLAAWLAMHAGRADGARRLRAVLERPAAGASRRRKAAWELALHDFESRRYRLAKDRFGMAQAERGERRIRYWIARCDEELGRRSAAEESYRALHTERPLEWYGLLAARRLAALGAPAAAAPPPLTSASPARAELPAEVRFYHELGLRQDAREALRRHEEELRRLHGDDADEIIARLYRELGAPERARRFAPRRRWSTDAPAWVWEAAFPRAYASELERALAELPGGTPRAYPAASYLWGTMRQESGYDVDAVSRAGAIGLLQLMPASAARIAAAAGLGAPQSRGGGGFRTELLFEPGWNLRLAARFVNRLHREFDGNSVLVMAAYNAGAAPVRRWIAARADAPLDLWVERIPYDETRRYVQRVSRHLARYEWIAGRIWLPPEELE